MATLNKYKIIGTATEPFVYAKHIELEVLACNETHALIMAKLDLQHPDAYTFSIIQISGETPAYITVGFSDN